MSSFLGGYLAGAGTAGFIVALIVLGLFYYARED